MAHLWFIYLVSAFFNNPILEPRSRVRKIKGLANFIFCVEHTYQISALCHYAMKVHHWLALGMGGVGKMKGVIFAWCASCHGITKSWPFDSYIVLALLNLEGTTF
ncbi:hypothetical protein L1049_005441 [Liquidambar formosana]|uniref:Uncharacterized protein n=1 Tax=Liquidambar formosana TaxID=63359 RepID=A0AAP0WZ84_LIQFO